MVELRRVQKRRIALIAQKLTFVVHTSVIRWNFSWFQKISFRLVDIYSGVFKVLDYIWLVGRNLRSVKEKKRLLFSLCFFFSFLVFRVVFFFFVYFLNYRGVNKLEIPVLSGWCGLLLESRELNFVLFFLFHFHEFLLFAWVVDTLRLIAFFFLYSIQIQLLIKRSLKLVVFPQRALKLLLELLRA